MTHKYSLTILGVHTVSVILSACFFFQFVLDITGLSTHGDDAGKLVVDNNNKNLCLHELSHNTANGSMNGSHAINVAVPAICIVAAYTLLRFLAHFYKQGSKGKDYVVAALLNLMGNNGDGKTGGYHKLLNGVLFSAHMVSLGMFACIYANVMHQTDGKFCRAPGFTTETDISVALWLLALAIALELVITAQNNMCKECVNFAPYNLSASFQEFAMSNWARIIVLFFTCAFAFVSFTLAMSSDLSCSSGNIRDMLYGSLFAVASLAILTTKPKAGHAVGFTCVIAAVAFISLAYHDLVYEKNSLSCTERVDAHNKKLDKAKALYVTVLLAFWSLLGWVMVDIGISIKHKADKSSTGMSSTGMGSNLDREVEVELVSTKKQQSLQFV